MSLPRVTNAVDRITSVRGSCLRVVFGESAGLEIALPGAGVVIGAGPTCDVVLPDPTASSKHASIVPSDEGFRVRDLGSRNGTWLDGAAVTQAVVPAGAVLRLGSSVIQLLPGEDSIELAPSAATSFGGMLGSSLAMRRVYAILERASTSSAPVLLLGESGTGKELAARAVHDHSLRRNGPFVVFDCGAASETLIESELFGYKRGAFTGANTDRVGAFAAVSGGSRGMRCSYGSQAPGTRSFPRRSPRKRRSRRRRVWMGTSGRVWLLGVSGALFVRDGSVEAGTWTEVGEPAGTSTDALWGTAGSGSDQVWLGGSETLRYYQK